jgi:hypothetical protein
MSKDNVPPHDTGRISHPLDDGGLEGDKLRLQTDDDLGPLANVQGARLPNPRIQVGLGDEVPDPRAEHSYGDIHRGSYLTDDEIRDGLARPTQLPQDGAEPPSTEQHQAPPAGRVDSAAAAQPVPVPLSRISHDWLGDGHYELLAEPAPPATGPGAGEAGFDGGSGEPAGARDLDTDVDVSTDTVPGAGVHRILADDEVLAEAEPVDTSDTPDVPGTPPTPPTWPEAPPEPQPTAPPDDAAVVVGGTGDDRLRGGQSTDAISGFDGDDRLDGRGGDDWIYGGAGDDRVSGGTGDDTILGEDGADYLSGDAGRDDIYGGAGDDSIDGGQDADRLVGGDGDDIIDGSGGDDTLWGGDGVDTLGGGSGEDSLIGGAGDDIITGDGDNDVAWGGDGNDSLWGGTGDDTLYGESGDDRLYGDGGNDVFYGGAGDDVADGGGGDDLFIFGVGSGNDHFDGGSGWPDAIRLEGIEVGPDTGVWTLDVEDGVQWAETETGLVFDEPASGQIALDDGSTLTFEGVSEIYWG